MTLQQIVMFRFTLFRLLTGKREIRCIGLLDLPEVLIVNILRSLPTQSKCQAESVCRTFRELLSNPAPGSPVWARVSLEDRMFQKPSVDVLKRWLLKRAQGISMLYHHGHHDDSSSSDGKPGHAIYRSINDKNRRDQQIALITIPYISKRLSPEASLHLNLTWVMTKALFTPEQPGLESQYWGTLSTILTALEVCVEAESLTEDMSAALSQLTRLQSLAMSTSTDAASANDLGIIDLDLLRLQTLSIACLNSNAIQINCPQLEELRLGWEISVPVRSFSGMPSSIWKLCLNLQKGSPLVQEILPSHKAMLQDITLSLSLDEGIPRILEELPNLIRMSLKHNSDSHMHLDRSLDPFLDMPELEKLELQSSWNKELMGGTGVCMWTPDALSFLGLAEMRVVQMRDTVPGRSIALIY